MLQSMGLQRIGRNLHIYSMYLYTHTHTHTHIYIYIKLFNKSIYKNSKGLLYLKGNSIYDYRRISSHEMKIRGLLGISQTARLKTQSERLPILPKNSDTNYKCRSFSFSCFCSFTEL